MGKLIDTQTQPAANQPQPAQLPYQQPEVDQAEDFEEPEPEAEPSLVEQIKETDLAITQQIIDQETPFKVVSDIGFLVQKAREANLIEVIEEVVEADFDIEQSFTLYIKNRSTDPQYTEELLAAAKTFLPLVKNIDLRPANYDQDLVDLSALSSIGLDNPGSPESQITE